MGAGRMRGWCMAQPPGRLAAVSLSWWPRSLAACTGVPGPDGRLDHRHHRGEHGHRFAAAGRHHRAARADHRVTRPRSVMRPRSPVWFGSTAAPTNPACRSTERTAGSVGRARSSRRVRVAGRRRVPLVRSRTAPWSAAHGPSSCVGIDAAGYTAVVLTAADRMRLVYGPDGTFLGRFDRAGRPTPGSGPTLSAALAASGVDVATLVDEAGRPVPFAGGVTGDPHVITIGGTRLTTQQTGEFQARAGDPDRPIQLRFEPMAHRRDVSVVSAAAVMVAGVRGRVQPPRAGSASAASSSLGHLRLPADFRGRRRGSGRSVAAGRRPGQPAGGGLAGRRDGVDDRRPGPRHDRGRPAAGAVGDQRAVRNRR